MAAKPMEQSLWLHAGQEYASSQEQFLISSFENLILYLLNHTAETTEELKTFAGDIQWEKSILYCKYSGQSKANSWISLCWISSNLENLDFPWKYYWCAQVR
ncbi:unnamed protein product [Blepharisma stoltei]|uniref:Uncharacterized protein n=1 Tax=Blepharisma stoltei TaxID=1481888 RepID=A0AAU9KAH4_9CILI|nr:unnamed protein product [Blepharisma stoltei]